MMATTGRSIGLATMLLMTTLLPACGGGGGGGGGSAAGGPTGGSGTVRFTGFGFVGASGIESAKPPVEDGAAQPPTLGAPLDLTILFHFDGVPAGVPTQANLPVFTTPSQVPTTAKPPAGVTSIPAKGSYSLVVHDDGTATVAFDPFVPTAPLQVDLSAPAPSVPGLLPGSTYTAMVSTASGKAFPNLVGGGGSVTFGTTANAALYYPQGAGDLEPPRLIASLPADFAGDFSPSPFSGTSPAVPVSSFPPGPSDFMLTFDKAVSPTGGNLLGEDLDGDGVPEPSFFLATRGTRLLVSHEVPAGALGAAAPFGALSGLEDGPGAVAAPDGSDIVLADGAPPGLGAGTASWPSAPSSLAVDLDTSRLWAVIPVDGGDDLLTLVDHVKGDPTYASQAVDGGGAPALVDTGLDDVVGLTVMLDGRLVAYDRSTRRIVELLPQWEAGDPLPGGASSRLTGLSLGDGVVGFRSAPLLPTGVVTVLELRDLAVAPDGLLYGLAEIDAVGTLALLRLNGIDADPDGAFDPEAGLFSGDADDVVMTFVDDYVDLVFDSSRSLLALDRGGDTIDRIEPGVGQSGVAVSDVARFGFAGPSPARALTRGTLQLPVDVALQANGDAGSVLQATPAGVLPVGATIQLMQRNTFASLVGVSPYSAGQGPQLPAVGAQELLEVVTALPQGNDPAPYIDDVYFEDFLDSDEESPDPLAESPPAEWAELNALGSPTGGLRASVGLGPLGVIGDFLPLPNSDFDASRAYDRTKNPPEPTVSIENVNYKVIVLDTDVQTFPLPDGSTPGVTQPVTVFGGSFAFRDFIVPEGVQVVARGSRPLRITATGDVRIDGLIDVRGTDGFSDDTFDSGFLPVPAGAGGPGGGRGGDGHPTLFDPTGPGTIDQYVTPERGERGWGPRLQGGGQVVMAPIGGWGGLSTLGYDPSPTGYPKLDNSDNDEFHRPPGGGGGSFYYTGQTSHEGSGAYRVQSSSSWFPFTKCTVNDKRQDALYGNNENIWAGSQPNTPLQCVYLDGTIADHANKQPGAPPGDLVFVDDDPGNDFIGVGGELPVLIGGQGGGGGGSRVDSMRHLIWSASVVGAPDSPFVAPHYTSLFLGVYTSPTLFDAKPGAGGGGGGSILIRSFGDIEIGRTGRIDARGGHGGGGEVVRNSAFAGGGGGGSGGAVLLQAAGSITVRADPGHRSAGYQDNDGDMGAAVDVSGGFGRDARTAAGDTAQFAALTYDATRSDGGQGGFGLIQLQPGDGSGLPVVEQGAFLFAAQRGMLKLGAWTGDGTFLQGDNLEFSGPTSLPNELRYIDMLHYRYFRPDGTIGNTARDRYYVLNGTWPPLIPSVDGDTGQDTIHEYPQGSGQFWFDTPMLANELTQGELVVREPQPEKIMKTYAGWNGAFFENNNPPDHPEFPGVPGSLYAETDELPFCVDLVEPDGTPPMVEVDGQQVVDPAVLVDRLPVVHPSVTPPPLGTVSRGLSRWIDFSGATLRPRDLLGRTPPFFEPVHGTYNAAVGPVPAGKAGRIVLGGVVPSTSFAARYVAQAGLSDPGLLPSVPAGEVNPPYNDLKVDAPDPGIGLENVLTDNASVTLLFQGAFPVRVGSQVPDTSTLTAWTPDLTELDGYPLVRFQVAFDLGEDEASPYGPDSLRPQVDWVRLRTKY